MEIAQTIEDSLKQYYDSMGKPVPRWKLKRNPDWWTTYLEDLGIDPRNP